MNDKTLHQRMTETINMWYEDEDYDEWWIYQRDYLEARNTIEALQSRIEELEAEKAQAAKAERDRLRNLPDDAVFDAWYKLRTERFMTIPEGDIRFIATALADALESKP